MCVCVCVCVNNVIPLVHFILQIMLRNKQVGSYCIIQYLEIFCSCHKKKNLLFQNISYLKRSSSLALMIT